MVRLSESQVLFFLRQDGADYVCQFPIVSSQKSDLLNQVAMHGTFDRCGANHYSQRSKKGTDPAQPSSAYRPNRQGAAWLGRPGRHRSAEGITVPLFMTKRLL